MKRYYSGQQVICLTGKMMKDQIFTVNAVSFCPGCGIQLVDVGFRKSPLKLICAQGCGHTRIITNGVHWFKASCFAPLDFDQFKQISFEQLHKEQPISSN